MRAKAWRDVYDKCRQTLAPRFSRQAAALATRAKPLYTHARTLRAHLARAFTRSTKAMRACLQTAQKRLQAYWQALRKNPARSVAWGLMGLSVGFGLFSVFVAGGLYERYESKRERDNTQRAALIATPATSPAPESSQSLKSSTKPAKPPAPSKSQAPSLATSGTRHALQTTAPVMPKPDESESIIAGSLTYGNAIAIARQNLLEHDFTRARIWIYRAYLIAPNIQEVWDLYWQSWDRDTRASIEQKQEAYALSLYARSYYRF